MNSGNDLMEIFTGIIKNSVQNEKGLTRKQQAGKNKTFIKPGIKLITKLHSKRVKGFAESIRTKGKAI